MWQHLRCGRWSAAGATFSQPLLRAWCRALWWLVAACAAAASGSALRRRAQQQSRTAGATLAIFYYCTTPEIAQHQPAADG